MNATVTISVVLEGNAVTISATIADLLARLENPTISASVTPELAPVEKPKKERSNRVLTDEQNAAIKERFAAGKAAAQEKREAEAAKNNVENKPATETEPGKNKADLAREASKAARARQSRPSIKLNKVTDSQPLDCRRGVLFKTPT
jgi:hypothetical protein